MERKFKGIACTREAVKSGKGAENWASSVILREPCRTSEYRSEVINMSVSLTFQYTPGANVSSGFVL